MLEKLFGSKARVKILKLFLGNPDQKYYIRQVARDLKLQLNSVRRELENLEAFGLLISNPGPIEEGEAPSREEFIKLVSGGGQRGRAKKQALPKQERKYFQANRNFILFEEIKSLILKAQILYERDFVEKLCRIGSPKALILTGFFVNDPDKHVDLLVIGRFNRSRLRRLIKELEDDLGREINYTYLSTSEFNYRRNITDIFLYSILEGRKLIVIDEVGLS